MNRKSVPLKPCRYVFRYFTILEVIVALAVLTVTIGTFLQMLTNAQSRSFKVSEKWLHTHMLMQGAEYVLLHTQSVSAVPERFFPYPGYEITVNYEPVQNLPDGYENEESFELRACVISLVRQRDGEVLDQLIVDRIYFENGILPEG